jgi:hypothetical protein
VPFTPPLIPLPDQVYVAEEGVTVELSVTVAELQVTEAFGVIVATGAVVSVFTETCAALVEQLLAGLVMVQV